MALFLDPELADEIGLVAIGGDLSPRTLLRAYTNGIFPWFNEGDPICWWSPDPRAIFELDGLHVSRRLARTIRTGKFRCTIDQNFASVMRGCADRAEGTWITEDMVKAYTRLHQLGIAHSVEVWQGEQLAGGTYGVALNAFFAAESMFTRVRDASKVALAFLFQHLNERGFLLVDTQMITPHTASLGAIEIQRSQYLERLKRALARKTSFIDA